MKTAKFYAVTILAALAMVFVSCSKDEIDSNPYAVSNGNAKDLSNFEKQGLVSLLETQKMHRDVYTWINDQFPSAVFTSLAESDGKYMELLSVKLDKYGIQNPTLDKLPGEFESHEVQNQYNEFVRLSFGDLKAMIENARVMEESMISLVRDQQLNLSGNDDLRQIYGDLIQESISQLNTLNDNMKGLIHIYAPKDEIREQ